MSLLEFIAEDKLMLISFAGFGALFVVGLLVNIVLNLVTLIQRLRDAANDKLPIDLIPDEPVDIPDIELPPVRPVPVQEVQPEIAESPEAAEMQKILRSVFADEEGAARRRALFDTIERVDIRKLVALTHQTLDGLQLKARQPS